MYAIRSYYAMLLMRLRHEREGAGDQVFIDRNEVAAANGKQRLQLLPGSAACRRIRLV